MPLLPAEMSIGQFFPPGSYDYSFTRFQERAHSELHTQVYQFAKAISEYLTITWLEKIGVGAAAEDFGPIYEELYLPRKVSLPPTPYILAEFLSTPSVQNCFRCGL